MSNPCAKQRSAHDHDAALPQRVWGLGVLGVVWCQSSVRFQSSNQIIDRHQRDAPRDITPHARKYKLEKIRIELRKYATDMSRAWAASGVHGVGQRMDRTLLKSSSSLSLARYCLATLRNFPDENQISASRHSRSTPRHIAQRRMGEPFELFPGVPCFAMAVVLNVLAETAALGSQLFHSGCL
jgi:hypothetical protein